MSKLIGRHVHGIYLDGCINCGGPIEDTRLLLGLPCNKCLPELPEKRDFKTIYLELLKNKTLKKPFKEIYNLNKWTKDFVKLFEKAVGNRPWKAQETWARRVLKGVSFSIVAPTGVGKTVFGILMSIYLSMFRGGKRTYKSYIILPTTPLVKQVYDKAVEYTRRLGRNPDDIVYYHSEMGRRERREFKDKIEKGEYKILITTNQFLSRRFDILKKTKFKFIFVDDVDAILRSSKNIERIISLLGYKDSGRLDRITEKLIELNRLRRKGGSEEEIEKIRGEIERLKRSVVGKGSKGILVISSATGRPRGIKVKLFRIVLNFDVGLRSETLRNIYDSYKIVKDESMYRKSLVELVRRLGYGGLIYVPVDRGIEYAREISEYLNSRGIKADYLVSGRLKPLDKLLNGELDVLVGVAIYYGVMVRGLDYPEHIRYAIFLGTPRFRFNARFTEPNITQIAKTLLILKDILKEDQENIEYWIRLSNRIIRSGSLYQIKKINEVLRGEREPETKTEARLLEALNFIKDVFKREEIIEKIKRHPDVVVEESEGELYLLIPDLYTYIQASGRTSRLYAGGITRGLSIILEDNEKLLRILMRRMEWIFEEVKWRKLDELDINEILKEIDKDREKVRLIRRGVLKGEFKDPIKPIFVVVESPNKARTIARFFGKPSIRRRNGLAVYEVTTGDLLIQIGSSGGHTYDIVESLKPYFDKGLLPDVYRDKEYYGVIVEDEYTYIPVYGSIKTCVNGHQFINPDEKNGVKVCPKCGSDYRDKKDIIDFLRDIALEVDTILIGTDPDTEGEKIGWDLAALLKPYTDKVKRIEFHEVTRKALTRAINNPKDFNERLVEAQIVRRIEDRWIGFELTRRIYKELRDELEKIPPPRKKGANYWVIFSRMGGWSAGRVQTPVLRWIVDRDEEFKRGRKNGVIIDIRDLGITLRLPYDEYPELRDIGEGIWFKVVFHPTYVEEVKPLPPYTTDTLISDANRFYRMSAQEVMKTAQELFEAGLITYHRTDSIHISEDGLKVAKTYLKLKYQEEGEKRFYPRRWGEEGTHEGIRPTKPLDIDMLREMIIQGDFIPPTRFDRRHYQLYRLIFNRFILSQLSPVEVEKVEFEIYLSNKLILRDTAIIKMRDEILENFYSVFYPIRRWIDLTPKNVFIPKEDIKETTIYMVNRYTQGDIIRLMKEREIGRPSTYSKIISTLLERKYVREIKPYLLSTKKGRYVNRFFHAPPYREFVSEERTRMIEKYMKDIEMGKRDYRDVLRLLYKEIKSLRVIEASVKDPRISGDTGFGKLYY